MIKRVLTATPSELIAMTGRELLSSIRMSEGRTLSVNARTRCANFTDGVSNAEVVAAFGADLVCLDTYSIHDPYIPGWASKNPDDDLPCKDLQTLLGRGHTFKEVEEKVGRPISIFLLICGDDEADAERQRKAYGDIIATEETLLKAKEEGVKWIKLDSYTVVLGEEFFRHVRKIRSIVSEDTIIQVARAHGSGILNMENTRDLITKDEVVALIEAGADVIGFPAPATYPGWDVPMCKEFVDLARAHGAVTGLGVHTSQEGSNPETLEHIALLAKMCGPDIHELGDSGFTESIIDPMNIMRYGVAIRGRRHHYRRMAVSIKR